MYLNPRVPAGGTDPVKKVISPQLHARDARNLRLELEDQHVAITAAVFGDSNACFISRRGGVHEAHFTRTVSLSSLPANSIVGGHHRVAWFNEGRADEKNENNVRGQSSFPRQAGRRAVRSGTQNSLTTDGFVERG